MRGVMAVDAPVRRMMVGLLIFVVIGVAGSIWRGDRPSTTAGYAIAGVIGGGFVIGCYLWARRKN
jgi:hypothetical protein